MANTETITIEVGTQAALDIYNNGELCSSEKFIVVEPLTLKAEQLASLGPCEVPDCECNSTNAAFVMCRDVCAQTNNEVLVVLRVFDITPHYSAFSPASPPTLAA